MQDAIYIFFFFALGSCVGSFLNVVVYRLPRNQSLSFPGSRCPACEHPLAWYDNIPIFGWIFLRGKCRYCGQAISPRYPIIEALTAGLFVAMYVSVFMAHQGPFWPLPDGQPPIRMSDLRQEWPIFGLYLFAIAGLLAVSLIDAELYLIPPSIPIWIAGVALLVHTLVDRFGVPGSLTASAPAAALAAGGTAGVIVSLVLLRLGVLPLSFAQGETSLEVDKLKHKEGDEPLIEYTAAQTRAEIRKEIVFLIPPLALGGAMVLLQMPHGPLHAVWQAAMAYDWLTGLLGCLLGGLVGGGVVWITRILGSLWLGKEAMGLGDIDILFAVGTVLGAGAAAVTFMISPFFGLPLAIGMLLFKSRRQLPFGPYLSIGAFVVMMFYWPIYNYLRPGVEFFGELLRSWL